MTLQKAENWLKQFVPKISIIFWWIGHLDADYIAKYIAGRTSGSIQLTEKQMLDADTDNDGEVTIKDAAAIARFHAGGLNHFCC